MAEMVDQKLFTQEELVVMNYLAHVRDQEEARLLAGEAQTLIRLVRRLALKISELQDLVDIAHDREA